VRADTSARQAGGRTLADFTVGAALPSMRKGPMTTLHIMRWSAAMENWHRIHYDHPFATRVDGLPDVLVNGSWKQQVMCQYVKDLLGPDGWLWKVRFQFREMDPSGNTIIAGGQVLEAAEYQGLGYVLLEIHLSNQTSVITTRGAATGVVPVAPGQAVPYPFVPPDRSPVTW